MRRAVLAGVAFVALVPTMASAQDPPPRVAIVVIIDGATLPELLANADLRAMASNGGAALMNGRTPARTSLTPTLDFHDVSPLPLTNHGVDLRYASSDEAARQVADFLADHPQPTLAMVVSTSPSAASAADGDELGAVIAAWGDPDELLSARGEPRALTSDSTRRAGVVATVDPAATVAEWLDLPYDAGAPIERTDEPAPVELYDRYLEYRRVAVPAAAASWIVMGVAAIVAIAILRIRDRASDRTFALAGALAATFPWLPLALLLAGHLPTLTIWTAVPFVVAVVGLGTAFTLWAERRWGILRAVAATGAAILAILLLEALTGWWGAVTPLVGGGQLDGGRFFGMPNAMIGLVLGAALYVALRLTPVAGAALLVACALVAGSPWTGANFGAAITLFAAAGLWLGVRAGRPWWITALLSGVTTVVGMAAISLMHRYLTERPTHVTAFLRDTTGPVAAIERFVERLGIGFDLIGDSPFALVPIVGTLVLLVLAARPPAWLASTFAASDAWHDVLVVLLLGSVVAYVANDTGAAALGFGFVLALAGVLVVSVAAARGKMGR